MKIDTNAFVDSLPIMGSGLLGIFIVTIVLIIGIYVLRVLTSRKAQAEETADTPIKETEAVTPDSTGKPAKKESAMDLMREREKKDFLESDDTFTISNDL